MKKLIVLLLGLLILPTNTANAEDGVIRIVSAPHQTFDGKFRNDELATELAPEGRLGKLLTENRNIRIWVIDPAVIDEVAAMSQGYTLQNGKDGLGAAIASTWLSRLTLATSGKTIIALAYGNPALDLANRLAPGELRFYYKYGKEKLESALNRKVVSAQFGQWGLGSANPSPVLRKKYTLNRQAITRLHSIVPAREVEKMRARLAVLLSPSLGKKDREFFTYSAASAVEAEINKLRITNGKYQLTSTKTKVPITLINEFDVPVTANLLLTPLSSRIQTNREVTVTLQPQSRTQYSIEFEVLASGATSVFATFANSDGAGVSNTSLLSLNSRLVDSRVAWFTTGAALLLFFAAGAQTLRRIRRSRR